MAYEKAYGKWYWKHNQRMLATYLMIVATLIIVPQLMFPYDPQSSSIPLALSAYVVFALNLLMALLVPLYQFRFLFNKRSVDLYYPLPMKKTTMYWLNYGLGAILVCVPNMIFFIFLLWVYSLLSAYDGRSSSVRIEPVCTCDLFRDEM